MLMVTYWGYCLCWSEMWLRPVLAVYIAGAIYLGREVAIQSHYNILALVLPIAAFIAHIACLPKLHPMTRGLASAGTTVHVTIALLGAAAVVGCTALLARPRRS